MPNELPMPGDWAAKMIPTLTEVVDETGGVQALPVRPELGEAPSSAVAVAGSTEDFLRLLEPQLHAQIAKAVSAALREQWGDLHLRIEAVVDQAVRTAIARALERHEKP